MRNVATAGKEPEDEDVYAMVEDELREAIPFSIREIISELKDNPLWMEIGKVLIITPVYERIDKFKLTDRLKGYIRDKQVSYEDFDKEIKKLKEKGYLRIEKHSLPDFYVSLRFAKAVEIAVLMEREIGYIPSFK